MNQKSEKEMRQELIDADVNESEIEGFTGEGWSMTDIYNHFHERGYFHNEEPADYERNHDRSKYT